MNKLLLIFALFLAGTAICQASPSYAQAGIQPEEAKVLSEYYYWDPKTGPKTFSDADIQKLFAKSITPLDGEYAEMHCSKLVWALAAVGDKNFSALLSKEPENIQQATLKWMSSLWGIKKMTYPLTQSFISKNAG